MINSRINIIIVGAGDAGRLLAGDIKDDHESGLNVIGFVDDDQEKWYLDIEGVPVLGPLSDLPVIVKEHEIDELYIAIPSQRGTTIRSIVELTMGLKLVYKILPRLSEVLLQDKSLSYLRYVRRVQPEDLLGGEILKTDQLTIGKYAKDQTILVTGAAGSIGSELSRQIVAYGAKRVVLYDWWENGIFELRNQIIENDPDADVFYVIGDIKDATRINQVIEQYQPSTIFHAAAYKHVPLMEAHGSEAVRNNIIGTKTVAEAAIKYGVNKFVLVSTDKAVNPTNIMGATKRAAEQVIHLLAQSQSTTTFCVVRFGNVINSNGSAIPYFERQIETGGPVTVTHKDVTRFFMTIPEAVHLILQTWTMGENNDLFVLDMGESIKIIDLARALITLHGYIPEEEIKISIVGLRPGEKLYEEVLVKEEETLSTSIEKVFRTKNYMNFDQTLFLENLEKLIVSIDNNRLDNDVVRTALQEIVTTYTPAKH